MASPFCYNENIVDLVVPEIEKDGQNFVIMPVLTAKRNSFANFSNFHVRYDT